MISKLEIVLGNIFNNDGNRTKRHGGSCYDTQPIFCSEGKTGQTVREKESKK